MLTEKGIHPRMTNEIGSDTATSPRGIETIFADLRTLALTDGSIHQISTIIYRDHVLTVDTKKGKVQDAPARRWSTAKLNKQEMLLLLGLAVQSKDGSTYSRSTCPVEFVPFVDKLFREMHDVINDEAASTFDPYAETLVESTSIGPLAREAIYYGAESFYLHQLAMFAPERYAADTAWLKQHAGATIDDFVSIAGYIVEKLLSQMSYVQLERKRGRTFAPHELTDSLLIRKSDLRERFGDAAEAFEMKFSTHAQQSNAGFNSPFDINAVSIAPLIDLGDFLYVPHQYRLLEVVYESPFYWMNGDAAYLPTASEHRGAFVEQTASRILRSVFGIENVFENVKLLDGSTVVGEIDVLVAYGEYLVIGQAKSKRITLKAKAGDAAALNTDFHGAIQHPFEQAQNCAALLRKGVICVDGAGRAFELPRLPRVFPAVFLSDAFPAVTMLSRALLKRADKEAPIVWDLGVLDCVSRVFPTPVDFLFYLKCRAEVFDTAISDSEYNYVGYHLRNKLVLPEGATLLMIDRDYATLVDDFMITADLGLNKPPPVGVLQAHKIPFVSAILNELKVAPPVVAAVAMDLYDFSSAALKSTSSMIKKARKEVKRGKALKAFSIKTAHGGMTYVVVSERSEKMFEAARAIASKRKYDAYSDRWYLLIDAIDTKNPIDALLPLVFPWEEDVAQAAHSARIASLFNSHEVFLISGKKVELKGTRD